MVSFAHTSEAAVSDTVRISSHSAGRRSPFFLSSLQDEKAVHSDIICRSLRTSSSRSHLAAYRRVLRLDEEPTILSSQQTQVCLLSPWSLGLDGMRPEASLGACQAGASAGVAVGLRGIRSPALEADTPWPCRLRCSILKAAGFLQIPCSALSPFLLFFFWYVYILFESTQANRQDYAKTM